MHLDLDTAKWLVPTCLATLSFLVGGGWPWKAARRLADLDLSDRMAEKFATKEHLADLRDDLNAWQLRVQQDFIVPLQEQTRATHELAQSVALLAQEQKHLGTDMDALTNEVRALRLQGLPRQNT